MHRIGRGPGRLSPHRPPQPTPVGPATRELLGAVGNTFGDEHDRAAVALIDGDEVRTAFVNADASTVFELGPITKALTGLLLADGIERGEVALDDPVGIHLALDGSDAASATLEQLATHRSGFRPGLPTRPGRASSTPPWRRMRMPSGTMTTSSPRRPPRTFPRKRDSRTATWVPPCSAWRSPRRPAPTTGPWSRRGCSDRRGCRRPWSSKRPTTCPSSMPAATPSTAARSSRGRSASTLLLRASRRPSTTCRPSRDQCSTGRSATVRRSNPLVELDDRFSIGYQWAVEKLVESHGHGQEGGTGGFSSMLPDRSRGRHGLDRALERSG